MIKRYTNTIDKEAGFTLIELLVVMAIVTVLAAIAIQQFAAARQRSFDAKAKSDLKNVASAEEAYFGDHATYKSCPDSTTCASSLPGIPTLSSGVTLAITATTSGFTGTSAHIKGSGTTFNWDSSQGGLQ